MTKPSITLDDLPMFASDSQLAEAIVGKNSAQKWMTDRLPTLANKPGFPPIDPFHGGRSVALVRKFYDGYIGLTGSATGKPDGQEDASAWERRRRRA